jgi:hypothetical protein
MLRKTAGKSFLGPYKKVRNSEAAMSEAREQEPESIDDMLQGSFDAAREQFDDDTPAETIEPEKVEKPAPEKPERKPVEKSGITIELVEDEPEPELDGLEIH